MTMDPKRDTILQDLTRAMIARILKEASELASMCKMVNIPKHEYENAASAAFLFVFMELLSSSKPTMTPEELGQITKAQYKFYKELNNDTKTK